MKINKINFLRMKKRVTQWDLCQAIGMSESYLSKIENGKTKLNLDYAVKIAGYFNVSVEYILSPLTNDDLNLL